MNRILSLIPILVLLAACSFASPSTLAKLSALSPLEADPRDIAVALRLPAGVDVTDQGVHLSLSASRSDTGDTFSRQYKLQEIVADDWRLYQIDPADHAALRADQALAREWDAAAPRATSGALSVSAIFCAIGDGPAPDANVSAKIRTEADGPLLPLFTDIPLAKLDKRGAISTIQPCAAP